MREITTLKDNTLIYFDKGRFDEWCVYVKEPNGKVYIPLDKNYFSYFKNLSFKYSKKIVYDDFVFIYNKVSNTIESKVIEFIRNICEKYNIDKNEAELNLIVIYAAMVAERNKKNTILKEKIKHLGFFQTVVEGMPAEEAASFSKCMTARAILKICNSKGIN